MERAAEVEESRERGKEERDAGDEETVRSGRTGEIRRNKEGEKEREREMGVIQAERRRNGEG